MINIIWALAIFFAKVVEITLSSLKMIVLTKGQKFMAALMAFVECLVWAIVISGIISTLKTQPLWIFAYCFGYAVGYYLGSVIESKLAMGKCLVQFILPKEDETSVVAKLSELGCGVTYMEAKGAKEEVAVILSIVQRRNVKNVTEEVQTVSKNSVFTFVSDINKTFGGVGLKK